MAIYTCTCFDRTQGFHGGFFPWKISDTSQPKSAAAWRQRPFPKRCDCPKICPAGKTRGREERDLLLGNWERQNDHSQKRRFFAVCQGQRIYTKFNISNLYRLTYEKSYKFRSMDSTIYKHLWFFRFSWFNETWPYDLILKTPVLVNLEGIAIQLLVASFTPCPTHLHCSMQSLVQWQELLKHQGSIERNRLDPQEKHGKTTFKNYVL